MPIALILYVALSAIILLRLELYPSVVRGADALAYVSFGHSFPSLDDLGTLRTYGYPFLTWIYSLAGGGLDPQTCALIGGVIQIGLYGATVFWLASQFREAAATAVVIGLLLNPVLVAVVADMLTEAPTLILAALMVGCLIKVAHSPRPLLWATVGALVTNFALMIRPSNIVLIVAWNLALIFAFRTARALIPYAGLWVATAAIAWAPQIAHNIALGHYGVLPAFPLFGGQLKWGVFIARYASFVHDNAAWSYALLNPWRASTSDIEPVRWYLEHPVDGLATVSGR